MLSTRFLELYTCLRFMQEVDKLSPDAVTMVNLLPSCFQLGAVLEGKTIHGYATRKSFCWKLLQLICMDGVVS